MDNKDYIILGLSIALVYLFMIGTGKVETPELLKNFTIIMTPQSTITNQIEKTIVQEKIVKVDLTQLFMPYQVVNPQFQQTCELGGGEYHWDADYVGCTHYGAGINCAQAQMLAIGVQCNSLSPLGGQFSCDASNIYCKYT